MNGEMTRGLLLGIAIGTPVGVSLGMLYAPHSGGVTRKLIVEKVSDARLEAVHLVEDTRRRARRIAKDARSRLKRQ